MKILPGLFPYPHLAKGRRYSGSLLDWPDVCQTCAHRQCESRINEDLHLCAYGFNYIWIGKDFLIAGVVLKQFHESTPARAKRLRAFADSTVAPQELAKAVERYKLLRSQQTSELEAQTEQSVRDWVEEERFKQDFLSTLRADIQRGLSFVHDYKQINAQISQSINVLVESSYSGVNIEQKLAKAKEPEKAIYYAAKLLEEKLNVAKFLINPEWLTTPDGCVKFRFHGCVHKYARIYRSGHGGQTLLLY